jgi:ABC-type uncharacterized transport system auxiliary subunit
MTRHVFTKAVLPALLSCALGCALLTKSDPTLLRYYSLDAARPRARLSGPATPPLQLRLGRVNASSYIRDRIAFRSSSVEVGYYDDLVWTEKPESYVRRDLARALFEDAGIQEIVSGVGATLDVDLEAFEELRGERVVLVRLSWQLRNDTVVLLRRTVTFRHALDVDSKDTSAAATDRAIAVALSAALQDAVDAVVGAVVPRLAADARETPPEEGRAPVGTR